MIPQDLLAILRCPHCVHGPTAHLTADPGRLELVRDAWLVCQEPGCGRKYPILDGIPDMRIPTGDRWLGTPVAQLLPPQP